MERGTRVPGGDQQSRPRIRRAALALALGAAALAGCGPSDSATKPPPEVGFAVLAPTTAPLISELPGRTSAFRTAEVRPQVSGIIQQRLFAEGALVHQGQPLYRIDASLYRAAQMQAAANLSSAQANAGAATARADRYRPLAADKAEFTLKYGNNLPVAHPMNLRAAEMARRIDVARVYSRHVVERQLAGDQNLIAPVCFAKNTAVEAGEWVANQAVQLFGGMGYMSESEIERQYRDMRILGIGGGTTEIMTGLAAKTLGYQA